MNQFLAARQAEKKVSRQNNGWKSELINLGTLREVCTELGASKISSVRQKEGNPYISLYTADKQHLDSVMFSNALYAKHQKVEYDLVGLIDMPVYGVASTEEATGRVINRIYIGVTQGSADDLNDLADLMSKGAVNSGTQAAFAG